MTRPRMIHSMKFSKYVKYLSDINKIKRENNAIVKPFLQFDQLVDLPQYEDHSEDTDDNEGDCDVVTLVRPHVHLCQGDLHRQDGVLAFYRGEPLGKVLEDHDDKDEVEDEVDDVSALQVAQLHLKEAGDNRMFQQISKLSHIGKVFEPLCVNFRSLVPVSFLPFLSMLLNVNRPSLSFRTNLPMRKVNVRVEERKVKVKNPHFSKSQCRINIWLCKDIKLDSYEKVLVVSISS